MMQLSETKDILKSVAAVDNRTVTAETVTAWHEILKNLNYEVAKEGLRLAQQDPSIRYLEPRHIISWSKEASFRMNREMPEDLLITASDPAPVCEHGKSLPTCLPCCRNLANSLG